MRAADIDETDVRLIEILQKDSSTPAVRIAAMLRVTEGTVRNRITKLRKLGVIRRFTVSVDAMALGNGVTAFVLLNTVPGRLNEVAKKLAGIDVITEVHETHTYGDLLLKIRAKNPSNLADIISSRIKAVPGVAGTQVITVLNVWKD